MSCNLGRLVGVYAITKEEPIYLTRERRVYLVQFQATCSGISATSTVSRYAVPNLQSQICNLQSH